MSKKRPLTDTKLFVNTKRSHKLTQINHFISSGTVVSAPMLIAFIASFVALLVSSALLVVHIIWSRIQMRNVRQAQNSYAVVQLYLIIAS